MDLYDFQVFEAVAHSGGMTKASAVLNTVQSNVTGRIRRLETELGVPLFHRHKRGVQLTPAGEQLLPYARRVGLLLAEAKERFSKSSEPQGPLLIGSLDSTAALRLPPVMVKYATAYPLVDLTLVTGTASFLTGEVLHNRVEGAFVAGPVHHPDLEEKTVWVEDIAIYTPSRVKNLQSLARYGNLKILVYRAGCSYRQKLEQYLSQNGILGMKFLEFGSLDGIFGSVAAGLGVTLFPVGLSKMAWWRTQWGSRIHLHRIPHGITKVPTVFIRRKDAFCSAAMSRFFDTFEKFGT